MDNLDVTKQYTLVCFSGWSMPLGVSWAIQMRGRQTLRRLGRQQVISKLKLSEITTHTAMCVHLKAGWIVLESHWDTGVHAIPLSKWLSRKDSRVIAVEDSFDVEKAMEYLTTPYGKADIIGFFGDYVINFFKKDYHSVLHKLDQGIFCSEYVALCQSGQDIVEYFKLPACAIEPSHVWLWSQEIGRNSIKISVV